MDECLESNQNGRSASTDRREQKERFVLFLSSDQPRLRHDLTTGALLARARMSLYVFSLLQTSLRQSAMVKSLGVHGRAWHTTTKRWPSGPDRNPICSLSPKGRTEGEQFKPE